MRPEDVLTAYSYNSLRTMARVRDYSMTALRRAELIPALAERLWDTAELERMIKQLTANELATLQVMVDGGGRLLRDELLQTLLERGIVHELGLLRPRETIDRIAPTTKRFDELCARLTARGLLFTEPTATSLANPYDLAPGTVLFVPGAVLDFLLRADTVDDELVEPANTKERQLTVQGRLLIQPSYTVLLLPPLDEPTLQRLSSFAETVRITEVAEFRLTQQALHRAVTQGETVAAVISFLEARSEQPLPQNVRYTLDSWDQVFGQVQLYQSAAILEGPATVLDRLEVMPELAGLVVRRLSPERLVLRDAAQAEQRLVALGELPLAVRYDTQSGQHRFVVDVIGTITPTGSTADLLLPLALRRIAEPLGDGRFQLTPERLRTAVEVTPDGLTGILKWLRANGGDLPADLVTRLRVWSLSADAVALEQPLLLTLPPDLLTDLRSIPALAPLLADQFESSAAIVRINPNDRERLITALRDTGIELRDQG